MMAETVRNSLSVTAILIFCYTHVDAYGNISDLLYETCGGRNFCQRNASKIVIEERHTSCCQDCSCNSDCPINGNCCPDYLFNIDIDVPVLNCTTTDVLLNVDRLNYVLTAQNFFTNYKYRVIDYCPHKVTTSEEWRKLCQRPNKYLDLVPVSNPSGDLLFKNKFCALCHGHVNVVPWNLYLLGCLQLRTMDFKTTAARDKYILENCPFDALPPNRRYFQKVLCNDIRIAIVSSCNKTGRWNTYDPEIEAECETPQERVHSVFRSPSTNVYFKNVFCYLCNTNISGMKTNDSCSPGVIGTDPKIPTTFAFRILINFKQEEKTSDSKHKLCSQTQVFDPFMNVCRFVHCRIGYVPFNGECKPVGTVEGGTLVTAFTIIDMNGKTVYVEYLTTISSSIIAAFNDTIRNNHFPGCNYTVCYVSFHEYGSSLILLAGVNPLAPCSFEDMLQSIKAISKKRMTFLVTDGTRRFEVGYESKLEGLETMSANPIEFELLNRQICGDFIPVDLETLEKCPRIRLIVDGNKTSDDIMERLVDLNIDNRQFAGDPHQLTVCLTDYFSVMKEFKVSSSDSVVLTPDLAYAPFVTLCIYVLLQILQY